MYAKYRWDVLKTVPIIMNNNEMTKRKYGNKPVGTVVGEKQEEIAYDMLLDNAIDKLIRFELADRQETTDLRGYLAEYKKSVTELEKLINPQPNKLIK
jgi:hypothetical protein